MEQLENALTVSEISAAIKSCVDSPIFKGLEVVGEVSGFKFSGPHAYFVLKDRFAQLQCVLFYGAKTYNPKDGESVLLKGSLDYYVKGGRLSFQVSEIKPLGQGLLALEFERLKKKLETEGIFSDEHKKPIPQYAKNVLVVTSKTGAVIRDIVTTVRRKNPVLNIVVRDVRVQGEGAAKEISSVLKRLDKLGYDIIVIARGGGSLEDLAPFYDEELVRTIYAMDTPVVSAVGHETDFSLCDFVADRRAPTPTAAGELVAFDYYAMVQQIKDNSARLMRGAARKYEMAGMRTRHAFAELRRLATSFYQDKTRRVENALNKAQIEVNKKFEQNRSRLCDAIDRAQNSISRKFELNEAAVEKLMDRLDSLSPLSTLKRGYFRLKCNDKTLNGVKNIKVGDVISAQGSDGSLEAKVTDVTKIDL